MLHILLEGIVDSEAKAHGLLREMCALPPTKVMLLPPKVDLELHYLNRPGAAAAN